jgi:hypothetical protein
MSVLPTASRPCVGNSQQTVSIRRARMAWEQGAMIYNVMIEKGARRIQAHQRGPSHYPPFSARR